MGSFDTYCTICGGQPDVCDAATAGHENIHFELWGDSKVPELPIKTEEFAELIFDDKDRAFQREIALLGPIKDGRPMLDDDSISRETVLSVNLDDVDLLHNMVTQDYGVVESKDEIGQWTTWVTVGENICYLWAHETCFLLLHSFTRFTKSTFWDLFRRANIREFDGPACLMQGIDYLQISDSHEQYVYPWHAIYGEEMHNAFSRLSSLPNPVSSLRKLLLEDGQMWAFVAPDRFPIKEAFGHRLSTLPDRAFGANAILSVSKLPTDVLGSIALLVSTQDTRSLLLVSNHLRSKLLEIIDWASKQLIDVDSPWLLAKGDEETVRWEEEVAEAGGSEQAFPWFAYRWCCEKRSASMWNRRRIWKILKQMETLAEGLGVLSSESAL